MRLEVVVEARAAALEGQCPQRLELPLRSQPMPMPSIETAVRDEVEARGLLRDVERVRLGEDVHAGAEAEGLVAMATAVSPTSGSTKFVSGVTPILPLEL